MRILILLFLVSCLLSSCGTDKTTEPNLLPKEETRIAPVKSEPPLKPKKPFKWDGKGRPVASYSQTFDGKIFSVWQFFANGACAHSVRGGSPTGPVQKITEYSKEECDHLDNDLLYFYFPSGGVVLYSRGFEYLRVKDE